MCAIVVGVLAATTGPTLPSLNVWCVAVPAVVEILDERQAEVVDVGPERQHVRRLPSDWCQTDWPLGSRTGCGSPKPRTPRIVPK